MKTPARPAVVVNYEPKPPERGSRRDDVAYAAPMLVFLLLTWLGGSGFVKRYVPHAYPVSYVAKTIVVAALLAYFWRNYTKIRWTHLWLGVLVGVIGIFQWVPMQLWLQEHVWLFKPPPPEEVFNQYRDIGSPGLRLAFVAVRIAGATLLVPVMEELFWRDFLWRQVLAPNDFKLAKVGEWGWAPLLVVSGAFALVHGNWWLTSVVWGLMVGGLLVYTKSLGACIVAHGVTNLLLAVYVLTYKDWAFW